MVQRLFREQAIKLEAECARLKYALDAQAAELADVK